MARNRGFVPVLHAATAVRPDEVDTLVAADEVARALTRLGYQTGIIALDLNLSVLDALVDRKPRAAFNLVEAIRGDDRLIAIVPALLEHLNIAFTGGTADAFTATNSKRRAKQLMQAAGLPTPDWSSHGAGLDPAARYIIKADTQHGSLGMDAGSVVLGADCAKAIAASVTRHATCFFAERFVAGREFNVALIAGDADPRVLPIQEITFEDFDHDQPRIVGYAAKWDPGSRAYHTTPRKFGIEQSEPRLASTLTTLAVSAWHALQLTGYARVDFRVDETGQPFILEVNVNPAISSDAGLAAAAREAGMDYDDLVGRLVDEAVQRATRRQAWS